MRFNAGTRRAQSPMPRTGPVMEWDGKTCPHEWGHGSLKGYATALRRRINELRKGSRGMRGWLRQRWKRVKGKKSAAGAANESKLSIVCFRPTCKTRHEIGLVVSR